MKPNVSTRVSTLVPLVFVVSCVLGALPGAAQQLFRLGDRIDEPSIRGASEERRLDLDLGALTTKASHLDFNLEPGHWYRAQVVDVEHRTDDRFTWRGRIATPDDSGLLVNVTLTAHDGLLFGTLDLPSGTWVIEPSKSGEHRLAKIDASLFPTCGGGVEPDPMVSEPLVSETIDSAPTTGTVAQQSADKALSFVSVLGLYTPAARNGAGSPSAIQGLLQSSIDTTNTALINSQVAARVVLRHATEFNAVPERGNISISITELRNNAAANALRNQWSADLVAMIMERDTSFCGVGYVMRAPSAGFAPWAYSVTLRQCAVGNASFAHELGHNLGLEHNPSDSNATPGTASFPWSFGHFVDGKYRTVMSYSAPCTQGCPRRLYFSNPTVQTLGEPTGIANQRDNHRSLNSTTPIAARFRDVVLAADFEIAQESPRRDGPVKFLNTSTGEPTAVHWDFGDGTTSEELSPSHTYTQLGDYTVTLEITKGNQIRTTSQDLTVLDNLCVAGPGTLCLGRDDRFEVTATWQNFEGEAGVGTEVPSDAAGSGLLWFFDRNNWEMLVKVVDGCGFNDRFWVFSAATTNVEYELRVVDTLSGDVRSYFNPLGNAAAALTDTEAFASCALGDAGDPLAADKVARSAPPVDLSLLSSTPKNSEGCAEADLCLVDGRFRVAVDWVDFEGEVGDGTPAELRSDGSGLFWFFDANNWEMLVKVVDGCGFNDHFWVFSAATTNLGYTLEVTDLETGLVRTYDNTLGVAAPALNDTEAFDTCP